MARVSHSCRLAYASLLALLLAAPAVGQPDPASPPSTESALAAAEGALAAGKAAEAERLFRDLVAREPGLAEAYAGLTEALVAQNRDEEAAAVLLTLGEGLSEAGLYEPAIEALQRAAGLARRSGRIQAQLGRALVLDRKPQTAIQALERAVALGQTDLPTRHYLGAALWEDGRTDDAEKVYRQLVADTGSAGLAVQELGRLLLWQGKAAEAVDLLRRAATADPKSSDSWVELARALEATGAAAEAEQSYRKAVELAPQRSDARYGLALLLARSQAPAAREESARHLETYRRLTTEERERTRQEGLERARLDRGWSLLREGKPQEAVTQFTALPETPESLAGAAAAWSATGDPARAVQALERAVSLAPDRRDLRLKLAEQRLLAASSPP